MLQLPDDSKRHTIIGRTGSGKSVYANHSLSKRSITDKPWVVLNFKGDKLINSIPHAQFIGVEEMPRPDQPGVYIMQPPPDDCDGMDSIMGKIWSQGHTGLYVDEALMIGKPGSVCRPFRMLLTQGRSLETPLILCTQRTNWLDRFAFSETEFFQVFDLSDDREVDNLKPYIKGSIDMEALPEYHSYFYNVGARKSDPHRLVILPPCPPPQKILDHFDRRLKPAELAKTQKSFVVL